ncbi:MAG: restriction endonuclease [Nitrospinae bacterium]|nr:restriction endonuclease [Nitrospinota bacterium]
MDWQSYEELVKDIYQELGKATGVKIECWGRSCKVQGKSGVYHQVDVLTSHDDGIHTYKTAIDCKYWKRKVPKDYVATLSLILDDANIEKGVLVSKCGFSTSVKRLAALKNISLIQLREPKNSDWDGLIKEISIDLNLIVDEVYACEAICKNVNESHKNSFKNAGIELQVQIENQHLTSLREIADAVRKYPESHEEDIDEDVIGCKVHSSMNDGVRAYVVTFPDETVLMNPITGYKGNISELRFKVRERIIKSEIHIDHADHVSWIMEAIFEGKEYAISPDRIPTQWQ